MKHSDPHPRTTLQHAVTFDLTHGQVRLGPLEGDPRAMVVPALALIEVAHAAGEAATRELGRSLGLTLGARIVSRMQGGDAARSATVDALAAELAAELAMVGLGELAIERWGRALVIVVDGAPRSELDVGLTPAIAGPPKYAGDLLVASTIEGMLAAAVARESRALPIARDGDRLRILIANVASIERVGAWLTQGVPWGEAITRLHAPRAASEEARA